MTVGVPRGSDLHRRYEVFFSVRSRHSDRQLASGEYDRLGKSLYHKAERRRRVGHRVGAVKNHKTVVFVILVIYKIRKFQPHRRFNVRRVDYRTEGIRVYPAGKLREFRNLVQYLAEVERLERIVRRIRLHSYRASGVDYKYG